MPKSTQNFDDQSSFHRVNYAGTENPQGLEADACRLINKNSLNEILEIIFWLLKSFSIFWCGRISECKYGRISGKVESLGNWDSEKLMKIGEFLGFEEYLRDFVVVEL